MNEAEWINKNTHSLRGKTVAITGATGGIGRELCRQLAGLRAKLVLINRDMSKYKELEKVLKAEFKELKIIGINADLEVMSEVKAATSALEAMGIDILILCAGAYSIPRHRCETGYDNVYQINFVSQYYMARRLLDGIKERKGRIVCVGSIAYNYSKSDFSDIDFSKRSAASLVYGNSKRQLMFSLYGLCKGSDVLSVTHPGITFTNITAHYPKVIFAIIKHPMKVIFMKPKRAALCILKGVFEACTENEWIGPRIFDIWGLPVKKVLRTYSNAEVKAICVAAENIYKKLQEF